MVDWSSLLDGLSTIDDKLKVANDKLDRIADNTSTTRVSNSSRLDGVNTPRKKRSLSLTTKVPSNSTAEDIETMPFDGFVDGVILGWPLGADFSVGVRIVNNNTGEVYIPEGNDNYLVYNDFSDLFPVSFPMREGVEIKAEFDSNKGNPVPINVAVHAYEILPHENMEDIEDRLG